MAHQLLLLSVKIILPSLFLFLWFNSYLISLHFFQLLVTCISLALVVDTNPLKLVYLGLNLVHQNFWRDKFFYFSVWDWGIKYVIDLTPLVSLSSINNNQGLTFSVGSGSSSRPMYISVTIQGNTILDDVGNLEVQTSCRYICWYQNIYFLATFKSFQLCKTQFLVHVRM